MYKDITDIQLKFYLLFEIQGNVCPLHSMPGYSCEHYNKGTCIYEEDCIYYPNITDTKLVHKADMLVKDFRKKNYDMVEYKELSDSVRKYQRLTTLN